MRHIQHQDHAVISGTGLHVWDQAISDEDLAEFVGSALRTDFGESTSAIKQISRLTNTNPRAVKNWFQGKNAPSSGHLLLLAKSSPTIFLGSF